jgi:hypothetical protein
MMTSAGRTAPWMIAAVILAGAGLWLAGRIATAGPQTTGSAGPGPPTAPTKVHDRPSIDPLEAFDAAAWKGMKLDQVYGIVEDFQRLGLDQDSLDFMDPRILEGRQKQWYLEALDSALKLSEAQKSQARKSLSDLAPGDKPWNSGDRILLPPCPTWLMGEIAAPWNLCQLTTSQLSLTDFDRWQRAQGIGISRQPLSVQLPSWGEKPPDVLRDAGFVFPFRAGQSFPSGAGGELERQVLSLHPAQFQMLLLMDDIPEALLERLYPDP